MPRLLHSFKVPASLKGGLTGKMEFTSVGLVELNGHEEAMAAKRLTGGTVTLAWELAKESLRSINGQPVSTCEGTADTAWNEMHPKLRSLVMNKHNELHNPSKEESEAFLASAEVTTIP